MPVLPIDPDVTVRLIAKSIEAPEPHIRESKQHPGDARANPYSPVPTTAAEEVDDLWP